MDKNFFNAAAEVLAKEIEKTNHIDPHYFERYGVKRGLRNADGSGVLAGLTNICSVRGYMMNDAEKYPIDGQLLYRGYDINDIIENCERENRFCFEEVCWLLLFGALPNKNQLSGLCETLGELRELPEYFAEDMILKAPSRNIMNKLARSTLALYSYDDNPDDISISNLLRQSLEIIARMPTIMAYSYQAKRRHYDKKSMFFHPVDKNHSAAEMILSAIRADRKFTEDEARLLDVCLTLHAEHGGGNNSTFSARVLSSSGTDTYSTISAAMASLKGPKHGGANIKVTQMFEDMKFCVKDWTDDDEVRGYLEALLNKEAFDRKGLIYGMGHAIYSVSDPRAEIFKKFVKELAIEKGCEKEYALYEKVEKMAPEVIAQKRKMYKGVNANVDFYSGLVYSMLDLPPALYTPIFAAARIVGWSAHRLEELKNVDKIIRPAYKPLAPYRDYIKLDDR